VADLKVDLAAEDSNYDFHCVNQVITSRYRDLAEHIRPLKSSEPRILCHAARANYEVRLKSGPNVVQSVQGQTVIPILLRRYDGLERAVCPQAYRRQNEAAVPLHEFGANRDIEAADCAGGNADSCLKTSCV
jgi:hypothetical protein